MKWKEYSVFCDALAVEAVSSAFYDLGCEGVVVEDSQYIQDNPALETWAVKVIPDDFSDREFSVVKGYFAEDQEPLESLKAKLAEIEKFFGIQCLWYQEDKQEELWKEAWKKYYHTHKEGERIVICPTWESYTPTGDEIVIEIDPGMAFGTGVHPTTRFCLQLLEKWGGGRNKVLDAGCGSGILAIAAAKLGAQDVTAVDLDELAVRVCRENVEQNHLTDKIRTLEGNIIATIGDGQYELIMANLTADILLFLLPELVAAKALLPDGLLIISGILDVRWPEIQDKLDELGLEAVEILEESEWVGAVIKWAAEPAILNEIF